MHPVPGLAYRHGMLRDRLTRRLRPVRRAVLARRRLLAAVLAGVAVVGGVHAAAAPPPPSVPVLTATRDLPAGTVLDPDDLTTAAFAPDTVPAGLSTDPVGHTLAAALRRGEPVTDVRLVGPALTAGDPSRTAVPVRLPDAGMVALLEVGDRIDLVATDPQGGGSRVVAAGVPVLALPPPDAEVVAGQPGALVVLGVPPDEVPEVSDAGVRAFLAYAFSH